MTRIKTDQPCGAGATPCGKPARLYPCGWRCDQHKPGHGVYRLTPEGPVPIATQDNSTSGEQR